MASIRKIRTKWEARVRKIGFPTFCKSFTRKLDAINWAKKIEVELENGHVPITSQQKSIKFSELAERYLEEVSTLKKGYHSEKYRIKKIANSFLGKIQIINIKPQTVAVYRDLRRHQVSNSSIRKEIYLISSIFEIARKEWGIEGLNNPTRQIKIPKDNTGRTQRLTCEEKKRLLYCLRANNHQTLNHVVQFALTTAMRRGEITKLKWEDLDIRRNILTVKDSKNGQSRLLPLSDAALGILSVRNKQHEMVFNTTPNAVRLAWKRFQIKFDFGYLRFHDLRHEAISTFIELGLTFTEVAEIAGHKSIQQTHKYSHADLEKIIGKLN